MALRFAQLDAELHSVVPTHHFYWPAVRPHAGQYVFSLSQWSEVGRVLSKYPLKILLRDLVPA